MLISLVQAISVMLIVATLLPISTSRHWSVRVFEFPRLQILCALLIWLIVTAASTSLLWTLAIGACALYQLWWIKPFTRWHRKEVSESRTDDGHVTIKLLVSNVLMSNRDASTLIEMVNTDRPDVLAVLETDSWWEQQLDQLEGYPNRLSQPQSNLYGMHIYSKLPLHDERIEFLVESDVPSMNTKLELNDGTFVRFHLVHPKPPAPQENDRSTERDVELLLLARSLQNCTDHIIVAGDLNDVGWSATTRLFRQVSGLFDLRIGRGMLNTFHAKYWFLRWPLDHVFVSSSFRVRKINRLGYMGSDHFPMSVELSIETPKVADPPEIDHALMSDILTTDVAKNADPPVIRFLSGGDRGLFHNFVNFLRRILHRFSCVLHGVFYWPVIGLLKDAEREQ